MSDGKKLLFTPGPLTTHESVKRAMLRDLGSREENFTNVVGEIRRKIIEISRVNQGDYEAVLISGSGTSGIEAVLSSISSDSVKWLVISNGRYGERMVDILNVHGIPCEQLCCAEDQLPEIPLVENVLKEDQAITHVAIVHCETTTGIINDIKAVGKLCDTYGKTYFVDAMSSFGAIPLDFRGCHIDFLVSSPNKCLESVPGFSFVIAKHQKLEACEYHARTVTLNLHALWRMQQTKEQFCFTPPVQVLLAFQQALMELEKEGGFVARSKRYQKNHQLLVDGMRALGFETY